MSNMATTTLVFLFTLAQISAGTVTASAQIPIIGVITEAAKKAVMAIDLHIQELQSETLALENAQKELENEMQLDELSQITGWLRQQKDLYAGYYQELWQVKTVISDFKRIGDMLQKQGQIAIQFKKMQSAVSQDRHFSADEVSTMSNTLANIVNESARSISMLELAIKSLVTQMQDADRLRIIDDAGDGIDKNYADLQQFYQRSLLLSLERTQDQNDVAATKALYNIK